MGKRGTPARAVFEQKVVLADETIVQMRIVEVPDAVPGSRHRFKYSLFYGRPGERLVGYDNERPKGDHRHYGAREEAYRFTSVEQLVADFLADVARLRGAPKKDER